MNVPGYWMYETSGVLRPAIENYLNNRPMSPENIAAMRAYLRQWINSDFRGPEIELLRRLVDGLVTVEAIRRWIHLAVNADVDPL
jgi:hypothetical protein